MTQRLILLLIIGAQLLNEARAAYFAYTNWDSLEAAAHGEASGEMLWSLIGELLILVLVGLVIAKAIKHWRKRSVKNEETV